MISKKRDRDCSDSKVNTSLWCLFWHGCRAMYDKAITCDKTGAKPSEVYGGILAGVVSLEKTLQAICLIFSSLNTTATFVAPDKGKHPPGRRRGKTTLVVTFSAHLELGGANQGACQVWCAQRLSVSWAEVRAQYREAGSIRCHPRDLPDRPRRLF